MKPAVVIFRLIFYGTGREPCLGRIFYMLILFLLLISLVFSCSIETPHYVTLRIADDHPFETVSSEDMWYTLRYFDGKRIVEEHIPASVRTIERVPVYTGGMRPFILIPLGQLGPVGGFYEPGGSDLIMMKSEYGSFAEMLIGAAEYRPAAVSRVSVSSIMEDYEDLALIDELDFLDKLFDGTLRKGQLKTYEPEVLVFDSIPEGRWISERYDTPEFSVPLSGRPVYLRLHPGVFRYMNWQRGLLLTIAVSEEWEKSANISKAPVWY